MEQRMTYERPQEALRKRATRAIIENAIFDWKSGVVIALTILFYGLFAHQRWHGGGITWWAAS